MNVIEKARELDVAIRLMKDILSIMKQENNDNDKIFVVN